MRTKIQVGKAVLRPKTLRALSSAEGITLNADLITAEVPKLLTTAEAARVLGMKPQTLVLWRCKRRYPLRFLKMGGAVRYTMADLLKFLEAAGVTPAGTRKARLLRGHSPTRQAKSSTTI